MESENKLRDFLRPARAITIVGWAMMALCLAALFLGILKNSADETAEAVPFNPVAGESGAYCYLDIVAVSDWLYNYDNAIYYTAIDENADFYTVRLSDSQFAAMETQFDFFENGAENDPLPAPYRLYGLVQKTPGNVAEAVSDIWDVDAADYALYFGSLYLNGTTTPSGETSALYFLLALFAFLFGLCLVTVSVKGNRNAGKSIDRLIALGELENAAAELDSPENECFLKGGLRLGANYVFSKSTGMALPYRDILWCFPRVTRSGLIAVATMLIVHTATAKNVPLASAGRGKDADEIVEAVMATIAEKNPAALLGFTNENRKAYKAMRQDGE